MEIYGYRIICFISECIYACCCAFLTKLQNKGVQVYKDARESAIRAFDSCQNGGRGVGAKTNKKARNFFSLFSFLHRKIILLSHVCVIVSVLFGKCRRRIEFGACNVNNTIDVSDEIEIQLSCRFYYTGI